MNKILIYYPFTIPSQANSASMLRPIEMLHAFRSWGEQEGVSVLLISGNSQERAQQFKQLTASGELEDLLFCYVENRTIPIWLTDPNHIPKNPWIDRRVFQFLKGKNVPIGVFYRDVYWKFPELYPLKGWKKIVMKKIYHLEERFYDKFASVIFLPSKEIESYITMERPKVTLPPGGKWVSPNEEAKNDKIKRGIYVGGIRHDTGIGTLLNALQILKDKGTDFPLTVVCREKEFENIDPETKSKFTKLTVDVQHKSGMELDLIYQQMDIGFIPFHRNTYNDFAIPYKLFEYLSYQLPIIATDCTAQKEIIEKGKYGLVCADNSQEMAKAMEQMLIDHPSFKMNIQQSFLESHSWLARVRKVNDVLTKK